MEDRLLQRQALSPSWTRPALNLLLMTTLRRVLVVLLCILGLERARSSESRTVRERIPGRSAEVRDLARMDAENHRSPARPADEDPFPRRRRFHTELCLAPSPRPRIRRPRRR